MNEGDRCEECGKGTLKTELQGLYKILVCDRCSAVQHHPDEVKPSEYMITGNQKRLDK
jgi:hypothetical protein